MSDERPARQEPADALAGLELRCLVGPTAAGKSELAAALAERLGAEVVSLDSMLVYRGMDVGTAKPDAALRARVPHHMLDLVEPSERYDVRRFLAELDDAVRGVRARGREPLFAGGTAFYLKCLVDGLFEGPPADHAVRARLEAEAAAQGLGALHARLVAADPKSAARIHPNDRVRVVRALEVCEATGRPISDWQREWGWHGARSGGRPRRIVGLELQKPELEQRIARRAAAMLDAGWVEEARAIRAGPGFGQTARQALGYREVLALADGELDRAACEAQVTLRTRQFARRQGTWYRKFAEIDWVPASEPDTLDRALRHLLG